MDVDLKPRNAEIRFGHGAVSILVIMDVDLKREKWRTNRGACQEFQSLL